MTLNNRPRGQDSVEGYLIDIFQKKKKEKGFEYSVWYASFISSLLFSNNLTGKMSLKEIPIGYVPLSCFK